MASSLTCSYDLDNTEIQNEKILRPWPQQYMNHNQTIVKQHLVSPDSDGNMSSQPNLSFVPVMLFSTPLQHMLRISATMYSIPKKPFQLHKLTTAVVPTQGCTYRNVCNQSSLPGPEPIKIF